MFKSNHYRAFMRSKDGFLSLFFHIFAMFLFIFFWKVVPTRLWARQFGGGGGYVPLGHSAKYAPARSQVCGNINN